MLGQLTAEEGWGGRAERGELYGLPVLRTRANWEGFWGEGRLRRAGRALRRGGAMRALVPRDFGRWDVLGRCGLVPVDPGPFLEWLRDTAEILRRKKEVTWEIRGPSPWRIDREVVAQVAENLLVNAFRHARTAVDVRLSAEGGTLCLVVSDDGRGFSRRALERAAEPFYREESGGAMGMGLHICRLLCERHGGSLSLCNNGKGGGVACASFAM